MMFAPVIDVLALPPDSLVEQRVPKKLLLEHGVPTAADKRQVQDGIEEITWVAALKPTNIGIAAFKDNVREYLEIAVLTTELRDVAKPARLIELIHRAIPYPLVLVAAHKESVCVSLAHKRWSQGELGRVVTEDLHRTDWFRLQALTAELKAFLASLALSGLSSRDLFTLYQNWIDRVAALEAASITGTFAPPETAAAAAALHEGLAAHAKLKRDLATLRAQAAKEKQLNRRVELNLEIKRLEAEEARVKNRLDE